MSSSKITLTIAYLCSLVICTGATCPLNSLFPSSTYVPDAVTIPLGDSEVPGQVANGGLFLVTGTVNGFGPYTFIVDTGAAITVVSSRIASALPPSTRAIAAQGAGGAVIQAPLVHIETLDIAGMKFENFDGIVTDFQVSAGTPFDGIIGLCIFNDVTLAIDFPRETLRIRTDLLGPDECNQPITGATPTPDGGYMTASVNINLAGRQVLATVDTGNDTFLSLPNSYANLPFTGPLTPGVTGGLGGAIPVQIGTLDGLVEVACRGYQNPVVKLGFSDELLGAPIWQDLILFIDARSKLARFQQPN